MTLAFTITGILYSMKNSKTITTRGRRPRIIKHWKARNFESYFLSQVPEECRDLGLGSLENPLRATITAFYPNQRQDLDCALVYDLLQKAGVVKNDSYIHEKHEYRRLDKSNPRVEIRLEEI